MRTLSPVIWREGMHLAQHHFQLRDRYFEDTADFALSNLFFRPYGLTGIELDREALLNGTVDVTHARGVMPDGTPFSIPDDPPPEPLDVDEAFSPTREAHLVHLTLPAHRTSRANVDLEGSGANGGARFDPEERPVVDQTTGQDEKDVTVGRKNFRLVLGDGEEEGEEEDDGPERVSLPLARVRRDRSGDFVYDSSYIPPVLQIDASRRLQEMLKRLIEVMASKADALGGDAGGSELEMASDEVARFWLAHTISASLGPLRHHFRSGASHPEELYRELVRLAGALCTFAMESDPDDLPAYDHDDLEACFGALDRHVRDHLDVAFTKRAVRIPLEPTQEYFSRGVVEDGRCLGDAHWFLGVKVSGSRREVVEEVPALVKVCSQKHIERLVRTAHSGLGIEHASSPPAAIARRPGMEYFRIETSGPCWTSIVETGEVGVYAPEALANVDIEIAVVPEE